MDRLGSRIKGILRIKKISQKDLAKNIGITEKQIGRIVRSEEEPGVYKIAKIAQALNVSIDYLVTGVAPVPVKKKDMLGDRIKQIMKQKHISGNMLSAATGISEKKTARILDGKKKPKLHRIKAICECLGADLHELVFREKFAKKTDLYQEWFLDFSGKLSSAMRAGDLTQKNLSEAVNLSQSLISDYLNKKRQPSLPSFIKITRYLNPDLFERTLK